MGKLELSKTIEDYLAIEKNTESEVEALNQLALTIYDIESKDSDLYVLAKLLPDKYLHKVISHYDSNNGNAMKLPTKKEFHDCLLIALTFYLHEIKGYRWPEIREIVNYTKEEEKLFSAVSLGKKIAKLKKIILNKKTLLNLLKNLKEKEVLDVIKDKG